MQVYNLPQMQLTTDENIRIYRECQGGIEKIRP